MSPAVLEHPHSGGFLVVVGLLQLHAPLRFGPFCSSDRGEVSPVSSGTSLPFCDISPERILLLRIDLEQEKPSHPTLPPPELEVSAN